jgi:UDP-4-amino-4,6-dideoxy-N-acetyl-beta-L-altrosamine transaminase
MIPYGRQSIDETDIAAVEAVLRSDFLTQGPVVPNFEARLAELCQSQHAVAMNSATSALHVACLALGLGPGDWLWTSPITFVASANCARYCGAKVDFVDIDPQSFNLDPKALAQKLVTAAQKGTLPKVVVVVHMCGQPCDMAPIHQLSQQYGFRVIEDASHALGARYQGEPVGNGKYSDITVLSFHPVKIATSAEGGAALTQDPELAHTMTLLRSHGITRDPQRMATPPEGDWEYQQIMLGFNYRMTDVHAALGLSQLRRLESFLARRREWVRRYQVELADLPLELPTESPGCESSWHLYVVRLNPQMTSCSRAQLFSHMRQQGIGVNVHYMPVYRQPDYRAFGILAENFPHAENYYQRALSLPLYPDLTQEQQDAVVLALQEGLA